MTLDMLYTSSWSYSQAKTVLSGTNALPAAGFTTRSGWASPRLSDTSLLNPLNTDRMMMSAAVPMAMPATLMPEMMLITLCDFRANR